MRKDGHCGLIDHTIHPQFAWSGTEHLGFIPRPPGQRPSSYILNWWDDDVEAQLYPFNATQWDRTLLPVPTVASLSQEATFALSPIFSKRFTLVRDVLSRQIALSEIHLGDLPIARKLLQICRVTLIRMGNVPHFALSTIVYMTGIFQLAALETRAYLHYRAVLEQVTTEGKAVDTADDNLMGVFTFRATECSNYHRLGMPVWLIRPSFALSRSAVIGQVVCIEPMPPHIVEQDFTPPFQARFIGPAHSLRLRQEVSPLSLMRNRAAVIPSVPAVDRSSGECFLRFVKPEILNNIPDNSSRPSTSGTDSGTRCKNRIFAPWTEVLTVFLSAPHVVSVGILELFTRPNLAASFPSLVPFPSWIFALTTYHPDFAVVKGIPEYPGGTLYPHASVLLLAPGPEKLKAWMYLRNTWLSFVTTGLGHSMKRETWTRTLNFTRQRLAPPSSKPVHPPPSAPSRPNGRKSRKKNPKRLSEYIATADQVEAIFDQMNLVDFEVARERSALTVTYLGHTLDLRSPIEQHPLIPFVLWELYEVNFRSAVFDVDRRWMPQIWKDQAIFTDPYNLPLVVGESSEDVPITPDQLLDSRSAVISALWGGDGVTDIDTTTPVKGLGAADIGERATALRTFRDIMLSWTEVVPSGLRDVRIQTGSVSSFVAAERAILSAWVHCYWASFGQASPIIYARPAVP